jgi:two-component system CheB/CheR fusion protein
MPRPALRWSHAQRANRDLAAGVHDAGAKTNLANLLSRILAERFAPPAVLVDERGQIQQIHGRVGVYLELPAGRVNVNVIDMARKVCACRLRRRYARRSRTKIGLRSEAQFRSEGDRLTLNLKAFRLNEPRLTARLYVVAFETAKRQPRQRARNGETMADDRSTEGGKRLEQELRNTRRDLQGSIDELQTANEELAAANEEAQSANESFRAKRGASDRQGGNAITQRRAHTVNAELTQKLEAFERATDDLINLMNNIEIATIFLDCELRVMRFTPQARSVAHLIDADIGRPLVDLATVLDYPELLSDAASVITTLHV